MQDVIFAGGHGVPARNAAEVEVVIDAGGNGLGGFSELSIVRRIERDGAGEYRLNGARCRLVDVIEALSDTGLGKEMHSVVSQGRVESIIHSSPRDRRALVEEAAGLGKHRKRRRRAELKLARTQDNLARALDVEREARSRLRPLKRQAEAAELTSASSARAARPLRARAREPEQRRARSGRGRAGRHRGTRRAGRGRAAAWRGGAPSRDRRRRPLPPTAGRVSSSRARVFGAGCGARAHRDARRARR